MRSNRPAIVVVSTTCIATFPLFGTSFAAAQATTGDTATAAATASPPATSAAVVPAASGGVAGQASGPTGPAPVIMVQQTTTVEQRTDDDPARFRFGVEIGGEVLVGPAVGAGIGLAFRTGVQFNQWVGLYYQPHGIVGGWVSLSETAGAAGVIAAWLNSLNVELTLPFVHLAAGPSVDVLAVAGCGGDLASGTGGCLSGDTVFFGIDSRLALVLGGIGRGTRGGFAINVHAHPTFVGDTVLVTLTLGLGGELY